MTLLDAVPYAWCGLAFSLGWGFGEWRQRRRDRVRRGTAADIMHPVKPRPERKP